MEESEGSEGGMKESEWREVKDWMKWGEEKCEEEVS